MAASTSTSSGEWANPAVIGLLGFGITTMVTGLLNTNSVGVSPNPVLALALVFGGLAQLFAGIVALRKGEIFAGSAFTSYGAFWLAAFAMLAVLPVGFNIQPTFNDFTAFWGVWTLVTFTYVINAPKHGLGVTATFVLLFLAFILLTLHAWMASGGTVNDGFDKAMGAEIFLTGIVAWLTATATLTNANWGRRLIPL